MEEPPETPADERDGEPYYIDSDCPECGTILELYDPDSGWNDEWWCPTCEDGIHMDWPDAEFEELRTRVDNFEEMDK